MDLSAREEMAALYLLTNLRAPAARLWALEQPAHLCAQPLLATALQLAACASANNYVRYTRLLYSSRLPPPYRLAARQTTGHMAASCLRVMSAAYSSPACRYPLDHLAGLLRLEPEVIRRHCETSGMKILDGAFVQFSRSAASSVPAECHGSASSRANLSREEWRSFLLGLS